MWAVNQLIENNFEAFLNKDELENMNILKSYPNEYIYTNKKYYTVVKHDFKHYKYKKGNVQLSDAQFNEFKTKYLRRIASFNEILNSNKNILFIRFHESKDKIIYPEYESYYKTSELEYLFEYSDMLKRKCPELKFKVIFISKDLENNYHKDKNIIILKDNINIVDWVKCSFQIKQLFTDNKDFLLECINN